VCGPVVSKISPKGKTDRKGHMPLALIVRAEGSPFGTRLARVIRTMRDDGWECHIICQAGSVDRADAGSPGFDLRDDVTVYEFPVACSSREKLSQWIAAAGYLGTDHLRQLLVARLTEHTYDAIVVKDSPVLHLVFSVVDQMHGSHLPVVCEMVEPRVAQAYDSLIRYGTWYKELGGRVRRIVPRLSAVERAYLPRCDRIFVVVDEMKTWLIKTYGLNADDVSVVQNVPILSEFDAIHEPGIPSRTVPRVSFVGSLGPHRGLELLIEAAGLVRNRLPVPPDFRLAIVGGSPVQSRRLSGLCIHYGISDIVEIVPHVPHRTAIQWMKESDIGVIPHVDTPGIRTTVPFKLFDYMASGAACLVSDVGPLGRIVRKTDAGLTFQPGSAADLAEKLETLLTNQQRTRAFGTRGRQRSEQSLRWEIESRKYSQYFASLAS